MNSSATTEIKIIHLQLGVSKTELEPKNQIEPCQFGSVRS